MRAVDDESRRLRWSEIPKADMIGVHLNRLILHLVFSDAGVRALRHEGADLALLLTAAREATGKIFLWISEYIAARHDGEYLASFCKNLGKCEALANAHLHPERIHPTLAQPTYCRGSRTANRRVERSRGNARRQGDLRSIRPPSANPSMARQFGRAWSTSST
jgi:hypothetical protein